MAQLCHPMAGSCRQSDEHDDDERDQQAQREEQLDDGRAEDADGRVECGTGARLGLPRAVELHGEGRARDADDEPEGTGDETEDESGDEGDRGGERRRAPRTDGERAPGDVDEARDGGDEDEADDDDERGVGVPRRPPVDEEAGERERRAGHGGQEAPDDAEDGERERDPRDCGDHLSTHESAATDKTRPFCRPESPRGPQTSASPGTFW